MEDCIIHSHPSSFHLIHIPLVFIILIYTYLDCKEARVVTIERETKCIFFAIVLTVRRFFECSSNQSARCILHYEFKNHLFCKFLSLPRSVGI
jgi:hypothetical protein